MSDSRRSTDPFHQSLRLGLKVFTSLSFVGVAFWVTTGWITEQVLSQTYSTTTPLEAEGQQQVQLSLTVTVLAIDAEIDRSSKSTEVNVRAAGSALEEMEFNFPLTEFADVEKAIAQELGLSLEDTRKLIRYRIDG